MKTWQDILKQVGYPTDILTLDFETYFDADYSFANLSTIEYVNDPRFEFTGLGCGSDSINYFWDPEHLEERLREIPINDYTVLVQNARFDITVLQTKFGIVPKYIIDLKDLACHYDSQMSHSLKDLAIMSGLEPKGKTADFKGLHWADMTPEQKKALADYCIHDVELETELVKILLPKLSNPEVEIKLMRHTLDLWLHKRFDFDKDLADSLKIQMAGHIRKAIKKTGLIDHNYTIVNKKYFSKKGRIPEQQLSIEESGKLESSFREEAAELTRKELSGNKFVTYLQAALPIGETVPMKAGKRGNIAALAKNDDGCKLLLAHSVQSVQNLMLARQAVKSWPLHIKRINNMLHQVEANGGTLRVPLNYYGGHTGRWSGGEDINLQNFGGLGRAGTGIDPLIGQMRGLLRAPEGYTLGIGDSAQIEARILAWLAGQEDLLDNFRKGKDNYAIFAAKLFKTVVRKPKKSDPKPVTRILDIKRNFGKDSILGCGFGMGVERFYQNCLQNPFLRPLFDNGTYDRKFITLLIKTYRTVYYHIPEYWTKVERAFRQCIKFSHLRPTVGNISFSCSGSEVTVTLPSGRNLYYRHCRIDKTGTIKYHHGALWGGSITENIVQSIARDALSTWILRMGEAGLSVVLTVHDEIVCTLLKENAEDKLKQMADIMSNEIEWAKGLPLATEVKLTDVYTK